MTLLPVPPAVLLSCRPFIPSQHLDSVFRTSRALASCSSHRQLSNAMPSSNMRAPYNDNGVMKTPGQPSWPRPLRGDNGSAPPTSLIPPLIPFSSQQSRPWAMPPPFSTCHRLCRHRDSCPAPCYHAIPCLCHLAMRPLAVIVSVVLTAAMPPLAVVSPPCCPLLCCPMLSLYHPSLTRPSSLCGFLCHHHNDCSTPRWRHPPSSERQNLDLAKWILSADQIKLYLLQYIA